MFGSSVPPRWKSTVNHHSPANGFTADGVQVAEIPVMCPSQTNLTPCGCFLPLACEKTHPKNGENTNSNVIWGSLTKDIMDILIGIGLFDSCVKWKRSLNPIMCWSIYFSWFGNFSTQQLKFAKNRVWGPLGPFPRYFGRSNPTARFVSAIYDGDLWRRCFPYLDVPLEVRIHGKWVITPRNTQFISIGYNPFTDHWS